MKPSLKKPGDFTVAEGHGHPLVYTKTINIQSKVVFAMYKKNCQGLNKNEKAHPET
jgi:hypothetical protein